MTYLTLGLRNFLAQDPDLTALLGKSLSWPTWIFDEEIVGAKVENTQKCLIVISEDGSWTQPNEHNTLNFPRILVDVWADPTRNDDKSVRIPDATRKIKDIQKILDKHLHLVDGGTPMGGVWFWGTASEIATKTAVAISGSSRKEGPIFSPISNAPGAWMGRLTYGVNQM